VSAVHSALRARSWAELNEIVTKADVLQLIDRKGPAYYEWDSVFDRLLRNAAANTNSSLFYSPF
jgi:hypothetical protein